MNELNTETIESKIITILTLMGFENIPALDAPLHTWLDSLEVVELVYEVEKAFGVILLNDEMEGLKSLTELIELVNTKLTNKKVN